MVEVRQSTIIDAPIADVWRILRDFNGHDRWHPAVTTSAIEGGGPTDAVGSVRRFRLTNGGELREQLLSLSDAHCSLTYCLLEAPLPLMGYVASIRLKRVTDGDRTFWEWRSEFRPPRHRQDELVRLVTQDIYQGGFAAIRHLLDRRANAIALESRPTARAWSEAVTAPSAAPRPLTGAPIVLGAKAIVVASYGGPEVLRFQHVHLSEPQRGEVRIRHAAVGVNFIDVYCRTGYFDLLKPPGVPGMEAAGVIEAIGAGVSGVAIGDRVAYACPPVGAYCERRNMSAELLVHLSDDISDEVAAASLLKGVTASFLLHDVHKVEAGEVVVVHAAAGGVGQLLTQWARRLGATVVGVVSTDDKARVAERLGAHIVVVSSRESLDEVLGKLTSGRGADVVYDAVGKDTFDASIGALATRGHLVSFGQASGAIGERDIGRLASKSVTLSRPNYVHYADTPEKLGLHVARFFSALRQGIVSVEPPKRYDLSHAAQAHRDLESRQTTGSLILTV
jgi:NADPH2:quinone reductase